MNNYLSSLGNSKTRAYIKKTKYATQNNSAGIEENIYQIIPEEYDIFSEIDPTYLSRRDTKQDELISDCLLYMRNMLFSLYRSNEVAFLFPKLKITHDSDGTITFNWALSTCRAFLSFENELGDYAAYYGIVMQTDEDSVSTRTSKITSTNYKDAMKDLLQLVINNL